MWRRRGVDDLEVRFRCAYLMFEVRIPWVGTLLGGVRKRSSYGPWNLRNERNIVAGTLNVAFNNNAYKAS